MSGFSLPFQLPQIIDPELEFQKYTNWLISLNRRRMRAPKPESLPWDVTVNVTTHCQLACPYCETGNGSLNRSSGLLTPDRFNYYMQPIYDQLFILRMFGTGESLLNKQFPKMVEYTKDKEIFSLLSTNLSLKISDKQIDELLLCGLGIISVSIDGTTQETYSKYRRGGDYNLVVDNMRRMIIRKHELNLKYPIIEWRFLVFDHNKHEIDEARHLSYIYGCDQICISQGSAPEFGADVIMAKNVKNMHPPMSGPSFSQSLDKKKTVLLDAIKQLPDSARRVTGDIPKSLRYSKCDWLYFGATFFPTGGVSPCCISNHEPDDFGLMDPDQGINFNNIWVNGKYEEARKFFNPNMKNKSSEVICSSCPNMGAMDNKYVVPLRAIMRNAPAWVLKILACKPDYFFTNTDCYTLRPEMLGLQSCRDQLNGDWSEVVDRLCHEITKQGVHASEIGRQYTLFIDLLNNDDCCSTKNKEALQNLMAVSDQIAHKMIASST